MLLEENRSTFGDGLDLVRKSGDIDDLVADEGVNRSDRRTEGRGLRGRGGQGADTAQTAAAEAPETPTPEGPAASSGARDGETPQASFALGVKVVEGEGGG